MEPLARTYRIETERLVIRCYEPDDAPKLHEAITRSLDHLRPWLPWVQQEPKPPEARAASRINCRRELISKVLVHT